MHRSSLLLSSLASASNIELIFKGHAVTPMMKSNGSVIIAEKPVDGILIILFVEITFTDQKKMKVYS